MMASYIAGSASYETGFKSGFKAWGVGKKQWSLTIESMEADIKAVYLCAASQHSETVLGSSIAKTTWQHITPLLQSPLRIHLFLESYFAMYVQSISRCFLLFVPLVVEI